jgi:preprotein translocase subunit SecF
MSATQPAAAPVKKASFAHRLWTGEVSYEFVGRRRVWYAVSAVLLLVSILGLLVRGLELGIEFRGGSSFQVSVTNTDSTTIESYRQSVLDSGVPDLDATSVTGIGLDRIQVQTRSLDVDDQVKLRAALAQTAGVDPEAVAYQQIGASWGQQITRQAGIALVIFMLAVSILIWAYFRDGKMAISAIVCLIHDLTVTVGVYALVGFSVTPATLTGVLTILGYSLYDTVVVFDKVRENAAVLEETRMTYSEAANLAVNQCLVRSINTTVIGVLPVAALLFAGAFVLGSGPLEDIGLALFVGMIVGAYSSIFIGTPLLAQMKEREPSIKEQTERVERRRARQTKRTESWQQIEVVQAEDEAPTDQPVVPIDQPDAAPTVPIRPPTVGPEAAERRQPKRQSRADRKRSH